MRLFEGSMVALVTPFKNGKVDEVALRRLIDLQISAGTSAIVPCGTTGESATLTHDEHNRVIAITVEHVAKRIKVLAGAGSNCTDEAIRLHKFCHQVGADGALHITPYYNKPTQEGLLQHYQAIAKSADLPIVLYNVPSRTGVNMVAATTITLSQVDNIVGIKEASGSLDQASEILAGVHKNFSVISGEDSLTYPLYALGACGVISVTANLVPKDLAHQYAAVKAGDFVEARKIHYRLFDLHKLLFVETNPIPVKAALSLMGLIEEEFRLPLVPLSRGHREKLQSLLKEHDLISLGQEKK
jgi:4-hydroxy-tetrahydrodipicolinate synthase